jgi:prevent-host-death family protein
MAHRTVNVTEFKAKCLALLNDVAEHGSTMTITKRGKPLATIGPPKKRAAKSPEGIWAGKVEIPDELLMRDTSEDWECVPEASTRRR